MTEVTLSLGPLDSTELGQVRSWRNDHRIWRWTRQNDLISDSEQIRWFNKQSEDPTIKMWSIRAATVDKDKPVSHMVGVCGLTSIDYANSRAEFSLYIAPELHGRGFGYRALSILLEHGFSNLGLNLIWGETFDGNPATKTFEKVGMVKEGTRRQFYWKDGKRTDAHLYSLTREEWLGRLAGAVDRSGDSLRGDLQHDSLGNAGVSAQAGATIDCETVSSGASPRAEAESPKPHLAREKKGAAKASRSRRRDTLAS